MLPTIEFAIAFWEPDWLTPVSKVEAHFDPVRVRVMCVDQVEMTHAEWDERRAKIMSNGYSDWPTIYRRTPIAPRLHGQLTTPGMYAFGALHILAPPAARAMELARSPDEIRPSYPRGIVTDNLEGGNPLRLLHSPLSDDDEQAAKELFQAQALTKLQILAVPRMGTSVHVDVWFAPFHMPGMARLSPAASGLKARLPVEGE